MNDDDDSEERSANADQPLDTGGDASCDCVGNAAVVGGEQKKSPNSSFAAFVGGAGAAKSPKSSIMFLDCVVWVEKTLVGLTGVLRVLVVLVVFQPSGSWDEGDWGCNGSDQELGLDEDDAADMVNAVPFEVDEGRAYVLLEAGELWFGLAPNAAFVGNGCVDENWEEP